MKYLNKKITQRFLRLSKVRAVTLVVFALTLGVLLLTHANVFAGSSGTCSQDTQSQCVCGQNAQCCFNGEVAYVCGVNSQNEYTTLPIQGENAAPVSSTNSLMVSYFNAPVGSTSCYTLTNNPQLTNGVDEWITNQDCTADEFKYPLYVAMPVDADASTQSSHCYNGGNCNLIELYINPAINFLSVAVGIVVIISVVIGGIQYSASGDNAQSTEAAKRRIVNALLGGVLYLFLYGFLQFIVPGGFFNGG